MRILLESGNAWTASQAFAGLAFFPVLLQSAAEIAERTAETSADNCCSAC